MTSADKNIRVVGGVTNKLKDFSMFGTTQSTLQEPLLGLKNSTIDLLKMRSNYYLNFFYSLLLIFIGSLLFTTAKAQRLIKDYVIKNAVTLKTISPDSTDDADLERIGDAIGNAKIVMLGEQDHGDAPTFLAKTRLVKYLHEKKGFNVLAFESDFFALNYGWDKTSKKSPVIDSFILKNIFSVWTTCDA